MTVRSTSSIGARFMARCSSNCGKISRLRSTPRRVTKAFVRKMFGSNRDSRERERRLMTQQQDEKKPATMVAYELAIIGGTLSGDESTASGQVEKGGRWLRDIGGVPKGPWAYQFETFEAAQDFAHRLRQIGIEWAEIRI